MHEHATATMCRVSVLCGCFMPQLFHPSGKKSSNVKSKECLCRPTIVLPERTYSTLISHLDVVVNETVQALKLRANSWQPGAHNDVKAEVRIT